MKLLKYIGAVFALVAIYSCKKDLGNYTYTDIKAPVVDTTGLTGPYHVLRYGTIEIDPKVSLPTGGEVSYEWLLYSPVRTEEPRVISLSNERILNASIDEPIGSYRLEFIATDLSTNLKTNIVFNVEVTSGIDYGLLVLYQTSTGGDIDFIKTPAMTNTVTAGVHLKNLYSGTTGSPLPGNAKFVWHSKTANNLVNWIHVGSDEHLARFSGDDFSLIREQGQLFRRNGVTIAPEAFIFTQTSTYNVLINNGKLQATNITPEQDALFGGEAVYTSNYKLAPYLTEYVNFSFYPVAYDQLNRKFLRYYPSSNSMVDFAAPANPDQKFDLRNIGKEMLFMTSGVQNYTYSFFKDVTGVGRWLYVTDFNTGTDNGTQAKNVYEMTHLPEIQDAKHYLVSGIGPYAYYATNSKIYNYLYSSSNTAQIALTVPSGEEITALAYFRPRPRTGVADFEERALYVCTWNGSVGKVYEYPINETSGAIHATPNQVFEVAGKVINVTTKVK